MNDDEDTMAPGRDEEVAGALRVEPLDDVTRRRLIRAALEHAPAPGAASPRGRGLAILGVAASLLVGVVVGAVVVTRPETPATPTAAGSDRDAASSKAADTQPAEAAAAPAPPQPLGDLGAFDDLAGVARAIDVRLQEGRSGAAEEAASANAPCADHPAGDLVLVSAAGSATLAGRPVVARVGPTPSGEIVVVVLDATDCAVVASRPLPQA